MTLFPDENRLTFNTVDIFAIDLTPNDIKSDLYKLKTRSYYLKTRQYDPKSVKKHLKSVKHTPKSVKHNPKSEKKSPQTTAKNTPNDRKKHLSPLVRSRYHLILCLSRQKMSDKPIFIRHLSQSIHRAPSAGGGSRPLVEIVLYVFVSSAAVTKRPSI